jgi:hypothetical protein
MLSSALLCPFKDLLGLEPREPVVTECLDGNASYIVDLLLQSGLVTKPPAILGKELD